MPGKYRIILYAIIVIFLPIIAFAEEITYPNSSPKFECFDKNDLAIIQQEVDEGHQPWRSDPEYYAKFFLNFYYPDLSPNAREILPAKLTLQGSGPSIEMNCVYNTFIDLRDNNGWDVLNDDGKLKYPTATVVVMYRGKRHTVYLHKAFQTNLNSIWVVEKITVDDMSKKV